MFMKYPFIHYTKLCVYLVNKGPGSLSIQKIKLQFFSFLWRKVAIAQFVSIPSQGAQKGLIILCLPIQPDRGTPLKICKPPKRKLGRIWFCDGDGVTRLRFSREIRCLGMIEILLPWKINLPCFPEGSAYSHVAIFSVVCVGAVFCRYWCTIYGVYHCIVPNSSLVVNNDIEHRLTELGWWDDVSV